MVFQTENTSMSYDSLLSQLPPLAAWPTSVDEALPVGTKKYGWTTEEGETFSRSVTEEIRKAHQKGASIRSFVTDAPKTLALSLLEDTKDTRELYFGDEEVNGHLTISNKVVKGVFVYDTFDYENDKAVRYVFQASVTPNGDIVYSGTELTNYPILLTALGDVERYQKDASITVPAP